MVKWLIGVALVSLAALSQDSAAAPGQSEKQSGQKGAGDTAPRGTFKSPRSYTGAQSTSPGSQTFDMRNRRGDSLRLDVAEIRKLINDGDLITATHGARRLVREAGAAFGAKSMQAGEALDLSAEANIASHEGGKSGGDDAIVGTISRSMDIKREFLGFTPSPALNYEANSVLLPYSAELKEYLFLFQNSVKICEQALGTEHPLYATSLHNLADVLLMTGDHRGAETKYRRALEIRRRVLPEGSEEIGESLAALAHVEMRRRNYDAALPMYVEALSIREKTLGVQDELTAISLSNLGSIMTLKVAYAEAKSLYERALDIWNQIDVVDRSEFLTGISNFGVLLWKMGEYDRARALLGRAIALASNILGPESIHVAHRKVNMASLLIAMGDYDEARRLFVAAIVTVRSQEDNAEARIALSDYLNNFATLMRSIGNLDEARKLLDESIRIKERTLVHGDTSLPMVLNNLANLERGSGKLDRARELYEKSLMAISAERGPEHPDVAVAHSNLGGLYLDLDEFELARHHFDESLRIRTSSLGPEHPDVAVSLMNLANMMERHGELEQALEYHRRALEIRQEFLGEGHPAIAENLSSFSRLSFALGDIETAVDMGLRSEAVSRAHMAITALTLTENEALSYSSIREHEGLNLALSAALEGEKLSSTLVRRLWDAVVRSRALVLDEMASRQSVFAEVHPTELAPLVESLKTARRKLSHLALNGAEGDPVSSYRERWDEALREKEFAERELARAAASFERHRVRRRVGLDEVFRNLPVGSALVGYFFYHHYVTDEVSGARKRGRASYLAFVIKSPGEATIVQIGNEADVGGLIAGWMEEVSWPQLGRRPSGATVIDESNRRPEHVYRVVGKALRQFIWDPVSKHVKEATRIFIVPDGKINLVSFESLPVGQRNYLIEHDATFQYLSTEKDLVLQPPGTMSGAGLLAVGNPDYDDVSSFASLSAGQDPSRAPAKPSGNTHRGLPCSRLETLRFDALPHSKEEAEEVAKLWSERVKRDPRATYLTGSRATEDVFKREAPRHRMLHLATHAFFLGDGCRPRPGATRGIGGLVSGKKADQSPAFDNPLLLSGLAFAGANNRRSASAGEEDGILTAEEISSLNLTRVDTVVLSACDSGVGELVDGEGVFGLRRAFQIAGARTLVMSLWPVEDRSARTWMKSLYSSRLREGKSIVDAVRAANLRALERRREAKKSTHPFYWAAFVAVGR